MHKVLSRVRQEAEEKMIALYICLCLVHSGANKKVRATKNQVLAAFLSIFSDNYKRKNRKEFKLS